MPPSAPVSVEPIDRLEGVEDEWRALERSLPPDYGLGFDWLSAWARVYAPAALRLVRVGPPGEPLALALVEERARGRWELAGAPVSGHRGFLAVDQAVAWDALNGWLRGHPREWALLLAQTVPAAARALPGVRAREVPLFALDLPASPEAHLAERPAVHRKALKQKLRRLEREGGTVREVEPARHAEALRRFVALHQRRTRAKGERHPQIDERLVELLLALGGDLTLRAFELAVGDGVAGVTVRLDLRDTAFFYNAGIDPAAARLGPGVLLELASIRDAIDRGLRRYDLGPGDYRYKRDLGGEAHSRFDVAAASPTPRGALEGVRHEVLLRVRRAREGRRRRR